MTTALVIDTTIGALAQPQRVERVLLSGPRREELRHRKRLSRVNRACAIFSRKDVKASPRQATASDRRAWQGRPKPACLYV